MEEKGKLHIVMVPWLAFGHMIPYLELAKSLAQMGHRVSFLSTPRNIDRLPTVAHDLRPRINLVKLTPPPVDGLPEDAQSTVDVPLDHLPFILQLLDGLEGPLSSFLEDDPPPDWVIYDISVYWAPRVAAKYGIPTVFFAPFSAMTLSILGPPSVHLDLQPMTPEELTLTPPWVPFPTNVAFSYYGAEGIAKYIRRRQSSSGVTGGQRLGLTFQGSHVAAIRSCLEFEPEWILLLAELYQKPVFPIGLLSPHIPKIDNREHETWVDQEWLDTQKHESVVYVAFGSELQFNKEQMHELAIGLELSELPFFWAYRGDPSLLPLGFEERTKGRGVIRFGWAPQARLLAHTCIGCFLMHGGWGSSVEGLAFGKPLIMLPMIADQGLITRVMVGKKVGVEVPRNHEERKYARIGCFLMHGGWGSSVEGLAFGKPLIMLPMIADQGLITRVMVGKKVGVEVPRNERDGSFTQEGVAKSLKLVMGEDEGGSIRSNAREMMKIFADKEQHNQYIKDFADYLIEHRCRDCVPAPLA
ncbi:UDP-glycosyltransferase 91C1-like [Magnolia sinica]|uniref:UDP-glycosyltransferase 91C1-like n=1 Tax=Magnolia sinica TaxID=86752 RepID=UPI0026595107|nr:UDP-glycosyltransferase 91C1-like [Magnolia sinica]